MRKITQALLAFGAVSVMALGTSTSSQAQLCACDQYARYNPAFTEDYDQRRPDWRPPWRHQTQRYGGYDRPIYGEYEYYGPSEVDLYSDEYDKYVRRGNSRHFFRYYYKGFSTQ